MVGIAPPPPFLDALREPVVAGDRARPCRRERLLPTRAQFASYNGTAQIEASSDNIRRDRLNMRGNRVVNHAFHSHDHRTTGRLTNPADYGNECVEPSTTRLERTCSPLSSARSAAPNSCDSQDSTPWHRTVPPSAPRYMEQN